MKTRRTGFTLIEMMLVVAIIGILAGAMFGGYNYAVRAARKAKAVEAVANARTALEILFQKAEGWPHAILKATTHEQGFFVMDDNVAKVLFKYGLLGVDCKGDPSKAISSYKLRGVDRCGIADPWAQDVLKKSKYRDSEGNSLLSEPVPAGGTVRDHLIYFAVDQDDDGFVTKEEGAPVGRVRAKAITWCAGADGGLCDCSTAAPKTMSAAGRMISNTDNVYSWQRAQEAKSK